MMRLLITLAVALSLPLAAGSASAQQTDDLSAVMKTLATLWADGDAGGLVALGAGGGMDLEIQGNSMGPLTGRRAAAALRQLFTAKETVAVKAAVPSRVMGADNRAFAELTWEIRPAGGPVTERSKVFVGFVREGSRWKVSQIRILP